MDFLFDLTHQPDELAWFADDYEDDLEDEEQEPEQGTWQLEVEFMMRLA